MASEVAGAEKPMLGFRTLSHVPIDRELVAAELLDAGERAWLDAYHAETLHRIGSMVEDETRAWLTVACAPL